MLGPLPFVFFVWLRPINVLVSVVQSDEGHLPVPDAVVQSDEGHLPVPDAVVQSDEGHLPVPDGVHQQMLCVAPHQSEFPVDLMKLP